MSRTAELVGMLRNTDREFRRINRTRGLTRSDKTQLENFYIERIFAPEIRKVLPGATNGLAPSLRLLTAKDLDAVANRPQDDLSLREVQSHPVHSG